MAPMPYSPAECRRPEPTPLDHASHEATTFTPKTPLQALANGENSLGEVYDATGPLQWLNNVDSYFRKFMKFLGKCQGKTYVQEFK